MDVITFVLYFAVSLILMLIGLKSVPLLLIFSGAVGLLGAAQLFKDGSLTVPIGSCLVKAGVSVCTTANISTAGIPAATLLILLSLLSFSMLLRIVVTSRKAK